MRVYVGVGDELEEFTMYVSVRPQAAVSGSLCCIDSALQGANGASGKIKWNGE